MNPYIIGWLFIVGWRLWGLRHVSNVAKFHGEEWCFDAPVASGFYATGVGADFLRAYRTRLGAGFAVEMLLSLVGFALGGPPAAFWTFCGAMLLGSVYITITLKRFAKQAWEHALPAGAPLPTKRVIELTPRATGDYTSPAVLWMMRIATVLSLALVGAAWNRSPHDGSWLHWISIPAIVLYAQAGLLLIRRSLAEWRVCGIPADCAELALDFRNEARAFQISCFEVLRAWIVLFLVTWSIQVGIPQARTALWIFRMYCVFPLVALTIVWILRRQRRVVAAAQRLRGASQRPPQAELPRENMHLGGLVYYDPEQPSMFVRRRNFYAINLAHPRSRLCVAYCTGWLVIIATRLLMA